MQSNIVHKVSLKMLSILESNWIFFKKLTFTNKATCSYENETNFLFMGFPV